VKVLLLHALPLDERMWEPQQEALSEYEVVAPNLYGLGGSSIEGWAIAILRQVWDEFAVVGASMGGYVALALARLAPERVRGLVLAGSRADADSPERKQDRVETISLVQQQGADALWQKMKGMLTAGADADAEARTRELARGQATGDLVAALRAIRDRPDSTDVLASLEAPVVIAVGDQDERLSVDEAKALAKSAKKGRVALFEGAGHLPSIQQPDRFNEELLAFLGKVS
jgi:pimeloyl-ACP methyl ester carboxylesterase